MSLNSIIHDAIEANAANGVINRHAATETATEQVMADPDMTRTCVYSHVSKAIASNAKSRKREAADANTAQGTIFGLRDTHIIDDGEGTIKETAMLSRIEFAGLIRVRQEQVDRDLAYLETLRMAARETSGLWDKHPNWTWGQIEAEYSRRRAAA